MTRTVMRRPPCRRAGFTLARTIGPAAGLLYASTQALSPGVRGGPALGRGEEMRERHVQVRAQGKVLPVSSAEADDYFHS